MKLTIYVFGNQDVKSDNQALKAVKKLRTKYPQISFVHAKPNQDLPFDMTSNKPVDIIIMDVIYGLTQTTLFENADLNKISLPPRFSVHDFDLGFQLKYLKKVGRLGKVTIIGLPMQGKINYNSIHSIFKKLVAQDIQGS